MIPLQAEVRVWLATGHTDMRKGFDGLALLVQEKRKRDPHCGHLFVFRGRRGGLINRETRWGYVGIKTATFIDDEGTDTWIYPDPNDVDKDENAGHSGPIESGKPTADRKTQKPVLPKP